MPFNINEFQVTVANEGVARAAHFDAVITPPAVLSDLVDRTLTLRVQSAELPGRGVQTLENRYWGPSRKIGYQTNYTDMGISVLLSTDLREREFFNTWGDLILGPHRIGSLGNDSNFNVGYYDDYVGEILINQYLPDGNLARSVLLLETYPILVSSLPTAWDSNALHQLNVSFAYRFFREAGEEGTAAAFERETFSNPEEQRAGRQTRRTRREVISETTITWYGSHPSGGVGWNSFMPEERRQQILKENERLRDF